MSVGSTAESQKVGKQGRDDSIHQFSIPAQFPFFIIHVILQKGL